MIFDDDGWCIMVIEPMLLWLQVCIHELRADILYTWFGSDKGTLDIGKQSNFYPIFYSQKDPIFDT